VSRVLFITPPEADGGGEPMRRFAAGPELEAVQAVWSSRDGRALAVAEVLAERRGLQARELEQLAEGDRSSTGQVLPELFEPALHAFFGDPLLSHRGWETAAAAQERIRDALETVIARSPASGDIAIVSHGAVGTLLLCHLKGAPIQRTEDQPGDGHWFAFDRDSRAVASGWRPLG
jgi:broad specificity phosphatase PhoE